MIEFYLEIRLVHIAAALVSGGLFLLRGVALLAGARWAARAAPLRYLSYAADTVLLSAALMLMTLVQQYPFADAWLTVKALLLVVYIALGILAFGQARTRAARLGLWLAGLAVFGFIYSVARAHDPLGILSGLSG